MSEENTKSEKEARLLRAEADLTKHGFTTNDLVMILGRLRVRVNGISLTLGDHTFTLLLLLAEWASSAPGEAFTVDAIIRGIERNQERLGKLELSWVNPTKEQVHRAASELRSAIRKARGDVSASDTVEARKNKKAHHEVSIFQSVNGQGYRLNTPAGNVFVAPVVALLAEVEPSPETKKLTPNEL